MTKQDLVLHDTLKHLFWMFLLQGASFIVLGIMIAIYPSILVALVVSLFVWIGMTSVVTAVRIKTIGKDLSGE